MPAEAVARILVTGGHPRWSTASTALGRRRRRAVVFTLAAGDWFRQAELAATALVA